MVRTLRLILFAVLALVASTCAWGQTLPRETIDSLDVKVMNSATVALGTVRSVTGDSNVNLRQAAFDTQETLRGPSEAAIVCKTMIPPSRLEAWRRDSTPLLVFANTANGWLDAIDLRTASSPHRAISSRYSGDVVPVSTEEFEILRDREAILSYVRRLLRERPEVTKADRLTILPPQDALGLSWKKAAGPHGEGGLVVPIDAALERRAFEYLRRQDVGQVFRTVQMLKPFRSDQNVGRLKRLLDDPTYVVALKAEDWDGFEFRDFPVRAVAVETLKAWGVPVDESVIRERISRVATITRLRMDPDRRDFGFLRDAKRLEELTIPWGSISDEQMAVIGSLNGLTHLTINRARLGDSSLTYLSGLKNLRVLNLDSNAITDDGLKVLDGLSKLEEIHLVDTKVTSKGIEALKRTHPGIRITPDDSN